MNASIGHLFFAAPHDDILNIGNQWDGIVLVGTKLYATPFHARATLVIDVGTEHISAIAAPASLWDDFWDSSWAHSYTGSAHTGSVHRR